jgi:hypothetical protein
MNRTAHQRLTTAIIGRIGFAVLVVMAGFSIAVWWIVIVASVLPGLM